MRQTRYIFLMTLLVAAIAAQRVVASSPLRAAALPDVTYLAKQIARRISRDETKPVVRPGQIWRQLSLRRLRLKITRLVAMPRVRMVWPPELFATPPPALA